MATTSAFGWETPDDTDLVKDGASAIRTLGNSIDTSMSELKGGTTGQLLSKTSNTDMDFTWQLRGGQTLLSTTTLSGTSTTISGIPTSYQDLRIIVRNVVASGSDNYGYRLNGDTAGNYYNYNLQTADVVASGANGLTSSADLGFVGTSTTSYHKSSAIIDIPRYNDTSNCSALSVSSQFGYGSPRQLQNFLRYDNSAGITSITFRTAGGTSTFSSGTVYIYGVN